jgi:hypothetical protein
VTALPSSREEWPRGRLSLMSLGQDLTKPKPNRRILMITCRIKALTDNLRIELREELYLISDSKEYEEPQLWIGDYHCACSRKATRWSKPKYIMGIRGPALVPACDECAEDPISEGHWDNKRQATRCPSCNTPLSKHWCECDCREGVEARREAVLSDAGIG